MVAQALLEKAIAIDPNYGQALGVLATSHTFSAHMGWVDLETDCAGWPNARRWPRSAPTARTPGRIMRSARFISLPEALRRFAGRIRTGAAPQSELLAGPELLFRGTWLLRPVAGSRRGGRACDPAQSARPVSRAVLWLGLSRPIYRPQLRGSATAGACCDPPSRRLRRRTPRADGRRRHVGRPCAATGAAGPSPRPAQCFTGLG